MTPREELGSSAVDHRQLHVYLNLVISRHEAWLIDLDGTLYHAAPVKRRMLLELAVGGWTAIRTLRRFRQEHERIRKTPDTVADDLFALQLELTARALGDDPANVSRLVQDWMFERPLRWIQRYTRRDLVERASEFKRRGGKLAVVSDYPALRKLQAVRDWPSTEVVIASGEPGGPRRLKPNPDGYELAAQRLGVPAERCLVIGDREDADGEAARRAGMDFELVG